jgi:hypothetical protein
LAGSNEIAAILAEPKQTGRGQLARLRNVAEQKSRYRLARAAVKCKSGRKLSLRVNVKSKKTNAFSIILSYVSRGKDLNLIRCNGHHGPHTNFLEKQLIPKNTNHIHQLTERYQIKGKPEGFAVPTSEYHAAVAALEYLCNRFSIIDAVDATRGYTKRYPLLE